MSFDAEQRSTQDWNAAAYDRLSDPMTRWGARVLDRLELRGDETVLDAGCGSGRVTELLLQRLPTGFVTGADASASMLTEARRRLSGFEDRLALVRCDLLDLSPSTLGEHVPVDAVLSTATFHWIKDHERLFSNLAGTLRPGGQLVAQCGGAGNIDRLLTVVRGLGVERPGDWNYASVEDTRRRLAEAGFVDVEVWLHDEPTPFDTAEELMQYLETVCLRQAVAELPATERRSLLERVVSAMPDRTIDYVRLNMVARLKPT